MCLNAFVRDFFVTGSIMESDVFVDSCNASVLHCCISPLSSSALSSRHHPLTLALLAPLTLFFFSRTPSSASFSSRAACTAFPDITRRYARATLPSASLALTLPCLFELNLACVVVCVVVLQLRNVSCCALPIFDIVLLLFPCSHTNCSFCIYCFDLLSALFSFNSHMCPPTHYHVGLCMPRLPLNAHLFLNSIPAPCPLSPILTISPSFPR